MQKKLPIWSNGKVVRYSLISMEDWLRVKDRRWCLVALRGGYAKQSTQQALNRGESTYLHRVILNAPKGWDVDHINHNPLDNRRENLRLLRRADNVRHRRGPQKNNKTKCLGVYWNKHVCRWYSQMTVNGKVICKTFKTRKEAVFHAYSLRANQQLHNTK